MNRQLIEANLAFLERATLQGAEVRAFADVVNALQHERNQLLAMEQGGQSQAGLNGSIEPPDVSQPIPRDPAELPQ